MSFRKKLYHVTGKKTPEEIIKDRVRIIKELLKEKKLEATNNEENTQKIREEFYLDHLTVADKKGNVITTSGNGGALQEIMKSDLHRYMQENFPKAEIYTVRGNGKNRVVYNTENKIYLMETPGSISLPEIRRIADQIEEGEDQFPKESEEDA